MKKRITTIILFILSITTLYSYFISYSNFNNFDSSKKILEKNIYNDKKDGLSRRDFYCGCNYNSKKKVDLESCGYKNQIEGLKERGEKIEWEHIVPAENFGRSFYERKYGSNKCINKKGVKFKGRECAKTNELFNQMEGDIYNLYPVIGEINAIRSNYDYYVFSTGSIKNKNKIVTFSGCEYNIDKENKIAEPNKNIKGDIARVYFYFEKKYPKNFKISDKNKKIYEIWNKTDPISKEECSRYIKIKTTTGEENEVLKKLCKD